LSRFFNRSVNGVLLLDKPLGWSSNQALQRARVLLRARKAGHTGTLDPMATGLLPLCFGEATKFSAHLLEAPKTYQATLRLGWRSDTGDLEGTLTPGGPLPTAQACIDEVLAGFEGTHEQLPPMHSALKLQGRPLYEYARAGQEVERVPRIVEISHLSWSPLVGDLLSIQVTVSKGTYIRVLAQDMGEALGCGAFLHSLRRTATGPFAVAQAMTLEAFEALGEEPRLAGLLPVDSLVAGYAPCHLNRTQTGSILHGMTIPLECAHNSSARVRLYDDGGAFIGLGEQGAGQLKPLRLITEQGAD
jgi:tRNA pseudouridine55 synthase